MDTGGVGGAAHDPVQRIDLAHQMALAQPADRRVARHLADLARILRDEAHARADPSGGGCRLAPGVPAADHQHIEDRPIRHGRANVRTPPRSEEHTSELQSLMRISYAVFCLKKNTDTNTNQTQLK